LRMIEYLKNISKIYHKLFKMSIYPKLSDNIDQY
jgi:hypothetical protein